MREIVVPKSVTLPAVSTEPDGAEHEYSFLNFLREFLIAAPGMQDTDEHIGHLLEWDDVLAEFAKDGDDRFPSPKPPELPKRTGEDEADKAALAAFLAGPVAEAFREELRAHAHALQESRVGSSFQVSDAAFEAGKAACKAAIDAAMAAQKIHPMRAVKVLRQYHAFATSKTVTAQ